MIVKICLLLLIWKMELAMLHTISIGLVSCGGAGGFEGVFFSGKIVMLFIMINELVPINFTMTESLSLFVTPGENGSSFVNKLRYSQQHAY